MNAPRTQVAAALPLAAVFLGSLLFHEHYDLLILVAYFSSLALALLAVSSETRPDDPAPERRPR